MTFTKRSVVPRNVVLMAQGLALATTTFAACVIFLVPLTACAEEDAKGEKVPAGAPLPRPRIHAEPSSKSNAELDDQTGTHANASPVPVQRKDADAPGGVASSSARNESLGNDLADRGHPRAPKAPSPIPRSDKPWEAGIAPGQRETARQLLGEGNNFWSQARFSEAAEKFTQALAHWDHPKIHYNLALALVALDRPLESREHLLAAMRYGGRALSAKEVERVKFHLQDLERRRLSGIDVGCGIPGAAVRIDGRLAFTAPDRYQTVVLPGLHTITASKPGYVGTEHAATLSPGLTWVAQPRVYTDAELTRYRRRWPSLGAEPWVLTGAGAALLALGGVLTLSANAAIGDINERCRNAVRCEISGEISELNSRSTELRYLASFSLFSGGAAFVTGLLLTLLNLEEPYLVQAPKDQPHFVPLLPLTSGRALGVASRTRF